MNRRRAILVVTAVHASIAVVAVASTAVFYEPGAQVEYGTPLTWSLMLSWVPRVSVNSLSFALDPPYAATLFAALLLSLSVAVSSLPITHPRVVAALFCCQSLFLALPGGAWFGLVTLPVGLVLGGYDGEYLGEHWPVIEATGLWALASLGLALYFATSDNDAAHLAVVETPSAP